MRIFAIPVVCFMLYLFLIIPALSTPMTSDELMTWVYPARSLIETGKAVNPFGVTVYSAPPTYLYMQVFLYKLFGVSNASSRLIGIFSVFLQLVLLSLLGKILFSDVKDRLKFSLLASFLFITCPAAVQGSLLPYEDTALFPVLLTVFVYLFIRLNGAVSLKNTAILAAIFAVSLFAKLTTPPAVIFCMFAYYLLARNWKGAIQAVLVFVSGLCLFFACWTAYAKINGWNVMNPVNYAIWAFSTKGVLGQGADLSALVVTVVRLAIWTGPYLFLLAAFVLAQRIIGLAEKKKARSEDFLVVYTALIGIGYIIIGGVTFGFPKYHYPIFLTLAAVCALAFKNVWSRISFKELAVYAGVTFAAFFYFYFFIGDPVYLINFSLREATVSPGGAGQMMPIIVYKSVIYLLPAAFVYLAVGACSKYRKFSEKVLVSMVILIFASNFSLDIIQRRAPYMTRYCYGEAGFEDVVRYVGKKLSGQDSVLATNDMTYYLRYYDKDLPYSSDTVWYNLKKVMITIKDPSLKFVIYSIGHNDIRQFKTVILNMEFVSGLRRDFVLKRMGTYYVWQRAVSI